MEVSFRAAHKEDRCKSASVAIVVASHTKQEMNDVINLISTNQINSYNKLKQYREYSWSKGTNNAAMLAWCHYLYQHQAIAERGVCITYEEMVKKRREFIKDGQLN